MSSKQKEQPWMVALVPLFGDVRVGGTLRPRWREAVLIGNDAAKEEREHFYQIVIEIKWLPPEARAAILQTLGSSLTKRNLDDETRRIGRLEYQIKARKRPLKEIAAGEDITVATLKKQLQRFRKRERLGKEEIARRKEAEAGKRKK